MTPAEHEQLAVLLCREHFEGPHLEIGTAAGGTLCHMLGCLPEERGFVVVDRLRYFDGQRAAIERNLAAHGIARGRVELREASSAEAFAAASARGERFDFMLIDAGHKLIDVTRDLRWTRLLRPGGVVCLHDYDETPAHRGLKLAVDRFLRRHAEYEVEDRSDSLLTVRKRAWAAEREIDAWDGLEVARQWLPTRLVRTRAKWRKRWRRRFGATGA